MLATLLLALAATSAAPIQDVLPCGKPGVAGGLAAGTDMHRHAVDTNRYPQALCNDGSPAVFYFAPAAREEDRRKWIVFLQGGGSCGDGQACAERWCSVDSNFGMDKMTSTLTKPSIRAGGFLNPDPRNRFGSWNRVLIHYCSSDGWTGTNTTNAQASMNGETREYSIHLKGSSIIDAVLDTLRNAGKRRAVRPAGDGSGAPWPDLDTATFAGSSAGGGGVRQNADRVGEKLRATNPNLVDYRAVIDAISIIRQSDLDPEFETRMQQVWSETEVAFRAARVDASCDAAHPGEEWRCVENHHAVLHHVTTPFFLRADLQDQLVAGNFVEAGFGSYDEYGATLESQLRNLPMAEEPRGAEPGLFAPQCRHHESFTDNEPVFQVRVDGLSFHDLLWNWWSGAHPQQAIQQFAGAGAAPGCP